MPDALLSSKLFATSKKRKEDDLEDEDEMIHPMSCLVIRYVNNKDSLVGSVAKMP